MEYQVRQEEKCRKNFLPSFYIVREMKYRSSNVCVLILLSIRGCLLEKWRTGRCFFIPSYENPG